jgi:hypothetical protein
VRLLAAEEGAKGPVRVRSVALASVLLLWHSAWLKACLAVAPSLFLVCTRFDIGLHVLIKIGLALVCTWFNCKV